MEYNPAIGSRLVQSPSINSTAVAPITVLVVEDDELVRELAVEFLSDAGFQVLEAGNGEEALSLLESNPNIRVLFTDINMPGPLDGITLASMAAVQWPHLAIIIGSGNVLPRSGALPSGITFIRKPCDPESVIQLIREIIDGCRGAQEGRKVTVRVNLRNRGTC
jgi:CheY-like chemotaxis protein